MCHRLALSATLFATLVGCVPRWKSHVEVDRVPLGKVVVYRNGVAYYERRAQVRGGKLTVRVPRDRVDDFLKSLTVVDARTERPLPVGFPRQQADDAPVIDMQLDVGGVQGEGAVADVVMTYVTDAAAWKPSYRLVLGGEQAMLESWAIVDNLSGEDWKDVVVGVGSSSAMSFRYDLWSVRTVEREQLAADEQFAVAPPSAVSPYGGNGGGEAANQNLLVLDEEEIRDVSNLPGAGVVPPPAIAAATPAPPPVPTEVAGEAPAGRTGVVSGAVTDASNGSALPGVTVVIASPRGQQTAITDERGTYKITDLAPDTYQVTFYYADLTVERRGIAVGARRVTPVFQKLNVGAGAGETITLADRPPMIDPTSTTQGITIDQDYVRNVPPPGRSFGAALGAAGGAAGDGYGVSFSGSTSSENNYYISGGGEVVARDPYRGIAMGDDKLRKLAPALIKSRQYVVVEGYAAPGETNASARALDRANVVRNQLIDAGVSPGRVRAVGKGVGAGKASVQLVTESAPAAEAAAGPRRTADTRDAQPVGESHFDSGAPMTVVDGSSAMVSVLRATTSAREVYLYDGDGERGNARFAFKSVRLINPTESTLEAGPVTVYGDDRYIGEGLTEPIGPHAAVVVPYALDRQIVVDRTAATKDELSKLLTVQRGVLTAEVQHLRTTSLVITSRLRTPSTVYVRHAIEPGWELLEPGLPIERVGDALLVAVEVGPGETRTVELREATPMTRQLELGATATLDQLDVYVHSDRPTPALRDQLQAILRVHRNLYDTVDKIDTLRDQAREYRARAAELAAQLASLRKVKTAAALSRELATKAAEISTRLQATTIAIVDAQEQVMLLRVEFQDALAELHLPDAFAVAAAP